MPPYIGVAMYTVGRCGLLPEFRQPSRNYMTVTAMRSRQESFDSARHRARSGRELYTGLLWCPAGWGYRQVFVAITLPEEASNGLNRSVGFHGPGL
jgi:hypothetical protein